MADAANPAQKKAVHPIDGTPPPPPPHLSLQARVESGSYDRNSMPRCSCLPVGSPDNPKGYLVDFRVPDVSLSKKLVAEFLGTFILIFGATAAPIVNQKYGGVEGLFGNALCAGLAVMIVILSTGHISGAHLNPAVTISFAVFNHFPWAHVPAYVVAQVSASVCASFALKGVYHPFLSGGATVPSVPAVHAFFLEMIISFILLFVVTAVATDTRAVGELAGIAVGATVVLNIMIAGPGTGGSMNPVRTIGPAFASGNFRQVWIYLLAPIVGGILGAGAYSLVKLRDEETDVQPRQRIFSSKAVDEFSTSKV